MRHIFFWVLASGTALALISALGIAAYGRRALDLYRGPIAIGIGVALICGGAAFLLLYYRQLDTVALILPIGTVILGNLLWFFGERDYRKTKRRVLPLARAIAEAERAKKNQS